MSNTYDKFIRYKLSTKLLINFAKHSLTRSIISLL